MDLMDLNGMGGEPKAPSSIPKQPDVVQWQLKDGLIESQLGSSFRGISPPWASLADLIESQPWQDYELEASKWYRREA